MISLADVSVTLGGRVVLDRASANIEAGSFTVVVGPNGAGKSTLLKSIAGLVGYRGRILLDGKDLASLPARDRARTVAYLPQGHVFHWPISVRDAVAIGRIAHRSSPSHDNSAIEAAMAAAGIAEFADRPLTTLSGGERARVLLARALAVEAAVILADEPLAALDPAHQLTVLNLLLGQCATGATVIATLHDLTLAARFAHKVIVMNAGRLLAAGPPGEALSAGRVADVFGLETRSVEVDGAKLLVPWLPRADLRT